MQKADERKTEDDDCQRPSTESPERSDPPRHWSRSIAESRVAHAVPRDGLLRPGRKVMIALRGSLARYCVAIARGLEQGDAMAWIVLFVAGVLEIVWAYTMKLSEGFTRPGASVVTLAAMSASFGLLSIAMKTLPLGTAYTVWTGIGAVGAFVVGIVALGEPTRPTRVLAAVLIVAGIVLMKLSSK
jgi:quaternary ammonium compound-resistance protein SugE